MIKLCKSLAAWGTPGFSATLKQELAQLGADQLPLQKGLSTGNYVSNAPITVMILNIVGEEKMIRVKTGIFFQGIIGGCSCTDDPTPASDINEYCEIQLDIDRNSALTEVTLLVE